MTSRSTVLDATRDTMRSLGLTTMFGNPGSTEEPFLKNFPADFSYILGLQEAVVVAMADGWSRAMHRPVLVNLHTSAGVGNAMGSLATAWHNKTPLILTAGQQTREMMLLEPLLTNLDATTLPRPYVKLSLETVRAQDAPASLMRAHALAVQPPTGPVFVSWPLDDWDKPAGTPVQPRTVSTALGCGPDALRALAEALDGASSPALIVGAGLTRGGGWADIVALAEWLRCAVYEPPEDETASFPSNHPLYQGALPPAIGPLSEKLRGHDVVLVLGAPVFRYYPYVPGDYLPNGTRLFHITDDPAEAARAPIGDSLLTDPALAARLLASMAPPATRQPPAPRPKPEAPTPGNPMSADLLFHALNEARPDSAVLVQESLSNMKDLRRRWPITQPDAYYTMSSGILGYGLPAAIGVALAERQLGRRRPVLAVIGDGAFQYCLQALWTAAQHELPVVFVVPQNNEYAILKSFAALDDTTGLVGLDLPGIDIVSLARGYGCTAQQATTPGEVRDAVREAFGRAGPTVIVTPIDPKIPPLL